MKCPNCHKNISKPLKACDSCGYVYDNETYEKISVYFDLINELVHIRSLKESFQSSLENIVTKINSYEAFLNNRLENLAGTLKASYPEAKPVQQPLHEQVKPLEAPPVSAKETPIKKPSSHFEVRVGQKWLLIIGIVTMVFGIAYFDTVNYFV